MSNIGVPGLIIILAIIVLLFGARKIPEIAEGVSKGIKKFKDAQKDDTVNKIDTSEADKSSENKLSEDKDS